MGESLLKMLGVGKRLLDDPLFKAGDAICYPYVREGIIDIDDEHLCHKIVAIFPCEIPNCQEVFSSLLDFEMHYNSRHRFMCSQCRKYLPSAHLLDLHLSEVHDSFFAAQSERKAMYRCLVEECIVMSQNVSQRRCHCIETHKFPHDFRYDQPIRKNNKSNTQERSVSKMSSEDTIVDQPHVSKHFTFGHGKKGKTFLKNKKPWHVQQKSSEVEKSSNDISTSELMDTLPI